MRNVTPTHIILSADIDDCPSPDPCTNGACVDEVNGFSCTCDTGYETPTPSGCSGKFWITIAEDIFFLPTGKRYILLYRVTLKAGLKLYVELVMPIADLRKRSHYVLPGDDQADIIVAINSMFRYLDDLLNIENPYFEGMVYQIYSPVPSFTKLFKDISYPMFKTSHCKVL